MLLREGQLTLNLKKCYFLKTTVDFLGFEIDAGQVKPRAETTSAVLHFPVPILEHQVCKYLGQTGYFQHIVKALHSSATDQVKWKRGVEQEAAFQHLKQQLCQRPTLIIYGLETLTEVHTGPIRGNSFHGLHDTGSPKVFIQLNKKYIHYFLIDPFERVYHQGPVTPDDSPKTAVITPCYELWVAQHDPVVSPLRG